MIRLLLADDQELVRHGFCALISAEPDMEIVGEAATGSEAIDLAFQTKPDVILMDIRMPGVDGLDATRRILSDQRLAHVRVLVLTTFDDDKVLHDALSAGAAGFLLKDTHPARLLDGIRAVHAGEALLAPVLVRRLIDKFTEQPDPATSRDRLAPLTAREVEVLARVGLGDNNDEIAAALNISPLTAKTHVSRLISKLSVRDRPQLVVAAHATGLVPTRADRPE